MPNWELAFPGMQPKPNLRVYPEKPNLAHVELV